MIQKFLAFTILCLLIACKAGLQPADDGGEQDAGSGMATITGTVTYRERILLLPGSRLEVVLEDVSRADAPALQIARLEKIDPGQVPIPFELEYETSAIDPRMTYSLRARILDPEGSLLFINDTHVPVLTRDAGSHADITLVGTRKVALEDHPDTGAEPVGMALRGQFTLSGDAASFRDCETGRVFPVERSGQFTELLNAYLNSGIETGNSLTVALRGRYLERPDTDSNFNTINLIVDTFNNVSDDQDCSPTHHAALFNTYWKLVELDSKPLRRDEAMSQQREAHLVLNDQDHRAQGHGGCNRFFGDFTREGEKLAFSALGSTRMACPAGMETEQAFLLALGETDTARVSGEFLELFKDERSLARFEAVYF